jgi:drug/metabolite transporter (DMT)-like permease
VQGEHAFRRALVLFLLSGVCFSLLDATAKYLVRDNPLLIVIWARYVGQMLVITPVVWNRAGGGFWRTQHLRLQLLRSLCLAIATATFVGGLKYLPLAEGSAIAFLAPMFAILFSSMVLGERPTRARWLAAIGGFVGILILARPGSAVFHPATGLVILAAISNAFYQLLTRKLSKDSPHTTLFYSALVGAVGLTFLLPAVSLPPHLGAREAFFLLLLGVFAGTGHWFLIGAFLRAPASLIAPFTYMQIIWATLLGYLVFDQLPDGISGVGMAVIVASGVALVLHERRLHAAARSRRGRGL